MEEHLSEKSGATKEMEHSNEISENLKVDLQVQVENSVAPSKENTLIPTNCIQNETVIPHQCKVLPSKPSLLHDLRDHSPVENIAYVNRERTFSKRKNPISDLGVHGSGKSYVCNSNGKSIKNLEPLNSQFRTPTNQKLDHSDVCNNSDSPVSESLDIPATINTCVSEVHSSTLVGKSNLKSHSRKRQNSCYICKKTLARSTDLKRHLQTHTKLKPHYCDVCDKPFAQISTLKNHLLVHTNEKPHVCDLCSKPFARKGDLKTHLLTHTKEKLHVCGMCSKAFTHSSNFKRHLLTHTNEKPHVCDVCNKAFAHNCNLRRHLLTHFKDNVCTAQIC